MKKVKKRKHQSTAYLQRRIYALERQLAELETERAADKRLNLKLVMKLKDYEASECFTWRTKEGVSLKPINMDESHLRNTISYLQRTLVFQFGTTRWMARCEASVRALYEMLKEARRRDISI